MKSFLIFIALLFVAPVFSQQFKLEEIMKGEDFIGHSPVNPRWSADGRLIYFEWNADNSPGNSTYSYDPATTRVVKLQKGEIVVPQFDREQKNPMIYYIESGDLLRYDLRSKKKETVYSVAEKAYSLQFVKDPEKVFFMTGENLMSYSPKTGISQVTNFVRGKKPEEKKSSSLSEQQSELFEFVRNREATKQWRDSNTNERRFPSAIYFEKEESLQGIQISPDESFVFFRLVKNQEPNDTYYEDFITYDGYTHREAARSKVRDTEPESRMGIYDRKRDTFCFVSFSGLTDIRKRPDYFREYAITGDFEKDRSLFIHNAVFNKENSLAVIDLRACDNKDRWIVLTDPSTGKITELEHQHDEAWIGGPGISEWNEQPAVLGWLDEKTIFFQSEITGFSHLYSLDVSAGKKTQALTSGSFEIHDVSSATTRKHFISSRTRFIPESGTATKWLFQAER